MLVLFCIVMACLTAVVYYMMLEDANPGACLTIMVVNALACYVAFITSWWLGSIVWVAAIVGLAAIAIAWDAYYYEVQFVWDSCWKYLSGHRRSSHAACK